MALGAIDSSSNLGGPIRTYDSKSLKYEKVYRRVLIWPNVKRPGISNRAKHTIPPIVGFVIITATFIRNWVVGNYYWGNQCLVGLALVLLMGFIIYYFEIHIPIYLTSIAILALVLHYVGASMEGMTIGSIEFPPPNGAYSAFPWWDHVTHLFGSIAMVLIIGYFFQLYFASQGFMPHKSVVWLSAFALGIVFGVGVELYEFSGFRWFLTIDQGGYENTLWDLAYDTFGSATGAVVGGALDLFGAHSRSIQSSLEDFRKSKKRKGG